MKKSQAIQRSEKPGTGGNKLKKTSWIGKCVKGIRKHIRFKRTKTTTTTEIIVE
jgi:hypothetical protein